MITVSLETFMHLHNANGRFYAADAALDALAAKVREAVANNPAARVDLLPDFADYCDRLATLDGENE